MALAIDASTPATLPGTGNSNQTQLASNPFTPPSGSVLVIFATEGEAGTTIASMSGGGLTYQRYPGAQSINTGKTCSEVWWAAVPSSPGSMQVTVTWSAAHENQTRTITPLVLTGAAADQSAAHVVTNQGLSLPSATLAAMAASSWAIGVVHNWDGGGPTVPAGQTTTFNGIAQVVTTTSGDTAWVQGNTAPGNTNLKINDTAPSCDHSMVVVEVLAGAAGGTDASVTAVPADGVGQAPTPSVSATAAGGVSSTPAFATGGSPQSSSSISASSRVSATPASATGQAPPVNGIVSAVVTAALSTNTGQALAPSIGSAQSATVTAVAAESVGTAPSPTTSTSASTTVTATPAAATGSVATPSAVASAVVPAASALATGETLPAQGILSIEVTPGPCSATGGAVAPTVSISGSATVVALPCSALGAAMLPTVSGTASAAISAVPGLATGAAMAPTASASASGAVTAVPAVGNGSAGSPTVAAGVDISSTIISGTASAPVPGVNSTSGVTVAATAAVSAANASAPIPSAGSSTTVSSASSTGAASSPVVSAVIVLNAVPATAAGSSPTPSSSATALLHVGLTPATGASLPPSLSFGSVIAELAPATGFVPDVVVRSGSSIHAIHAAGVGSAIEPLVIITNPAVPTQRLVVTGTTQAELGEIPGQFVLGGPTETAIFRTAPGETEIGGTSEPPPRSIRA